MLSAVGAVAVDSVLLYFVVVQMLLNFTKYFAFLLYQQSAEVWPQQIFQQN